MNLSFDPETVDLYSIFNSSGSLKESFDVNSLCSSDKEHVHQNKLEADHCFICSEKYEPNYDAWDHSRDHAIVCPECDFTCAHQRSLENHMRDKKHSDTSVPEDIHLFFCLLCNKCITSHEKNAFVNLQKHKMDTHFEMFTSYSCNLCDYVTFKEHPSALLDHERKVHSLLRSALGGQSVRHYQCKFCKRLIVSKSRLVSHETFHLRNAQSERSFSQKLDFRTDTTPSTIRRKGRNVGCSAQESGNGNELVLSSPSSESAINVDTADESSNVNEKKCLTKRNLFLMAIDNQKYM